VRESGKFALWKVGLGYIHKIEFGLDQNIFTEAKKKDDEKVGKVNNEKFLPGPRRLRRSSTNKTLTNHVSTTAVNLSSPSLGVREWSAAWRRMINSVSGEGITNCEWMDGKAKNL
jgi:hypothetical protein